MSYFVTGGTGFIGRFLVANLLRRGDPTAPGGAMFRICSTTTATKTYNDTDCLAWPACAVAGRAL